MVEERVDSLAWLRKQVQAADKDLLGEMVKGVVEALMSAEVDARSERALVQVVTESYVRGVFTRQVEGLVRTLGVDKDEQEPGI